MCVSLLPSFCNELEKIALTSMQKAVDAGHISPEEVTARMGPAAGLGVRKGPIGAGYRHLSREQMVGGTDLSDTQLASHRQMNRGLGDAGLQQLGGKPTQYPGMGPATANGQVYVGPDSGAFMREAAEGKRLVPAARAFQNHPNPEVAGMAQKTIGALGTAPQAVDGTLYRSVVMHEGGEKALMQGLQNQAVSPTGPLSIPGRMVGSHLGALPILEEQHAAFRDPAAQKIMHNFRGEDPDNKFLRDKIKQFGGTAENPLPIGGKAHAKLEGAVARYAPAALPAVGARTFQAAHGTGHGPHLDVSAPRSTSFLKKITPHLPANMKSSLETTLRAGTSHMPDPGNIGQRILSLRNIVRK